MRGYALARPGPLPSREPGFCRLPAVPRMSVDQQTPARTETATAYAPASVGNVAVGFDSLGHALDAVGDRVTVTRLDRPRVEIEEIVGCEETLPLDPEQNTATAGLVAMVRE